MMFFCRQIICCLLLSFQFISFCSAESRDDYAYHKALSAAKQGDYEGPLATLNRLSHKYPKPNRYFYDYLSVLGWAGAYREIVSYKKEISLTKAPRYVLKNMAFAERKQQHFVQAQVSYQTIADRFPQFIDGKLGLVHVLTDQHRTTEALSTLQPLLKMQPQNSDLIRAQAYIYETQGKHLLALSSYEKLLLLNPSDTVSYKNKILLLNRLGASHLAYSLIKDPVAFTHQELARIRSDMAAHEVRWGEISPLLEKDRFNETDKAIRAIHGNIENTTLRFGKYSSTTLNNQFDLLVALRNRIKMKKVIALSDQLEAENIHIPAYARNAVCDALLYLEQPQKAEKCYLEVINAGYKQFNTKISLFYAYLENERFLEAQQWIKEIAVDEPNVLRGAGKKQIVKGHPKKTRAEAAKSLSIAFADNLALSHQQFEGLHHRSPYNIALRNELANIDYWRGWPRKAQEEYEIGLHQESKHLGLRLGQARNWQALKEWKKAEQSTELLFATFPEDKGIVKQKRLWDIHNMREFKTEISSSESSGGTNGSRALNIDSYLYSSPLDYNYRAFIHHRHNQAEFTEGSGLLNHAGVGLEYTAPNLLLTGELHHNHYDSNRVGISLSGEYEFDDHLSAALSLESVSHNTPLRALNQGIYAKSTSLATQYRWHESRSAGLNLSYLNFSDGNKRKSFGTFWSERWYSQYNYQFSTRVDLFSSKNSKDGAIYFNPERDLSGSIAFENNWLTWREYEDSFHQRLILTTGFYNQKNFSNGETWSILYEHRWEADYRFELIYGIVRSNRLYDGNHELGWNYYLTLDWRF